MDTTLTEMGHAYGKAKFSGLCPLSGLTVVAGSTHIRRLAMVWADGTVFDAYVHHKAAETMAFRGPGDGAASPWLRGLAVDPLAPAVEGTRISVWRRVAGAFEAQVDSWLLINGMWRNGRTGGRSTPKQLAAAFAKINPANVIASSAVAPWTPKPIASL